MSAITFYIPSGSGITPNLQQVLDVGNTAIDQSIGLSSSSTPQVSYIDPKQIILADSDADADILVTATGLHVETTSTGTPSVNIAPDQISWTDSSGDNIGTVINNNGVTVYDNTIGHTTIQPATAYFNDITGGLTTVDSTQIHIGKFASDKEIEINPVTVLISETTAKSATRSDSLTLYNGAGTDYFAKLSQDGNAGNLSIKKAGTNFAGSLIPFAPYTASRSWTGPDLSGTILLDANFNSTVNNLVAGTFTVADARITATSIVIPILTRPAGVMGINYSVSVTPGAYRITSVNNTGGVVNTDVSQITCLIYYK